MHGSDIAVEIQRSRFKVSISKLTQVFYESGTDDIRKQIRKADRTISQNTGSTQETKIGKRKAEIKKRTQEHQKTGRTISENMTQHIRKQGGRTSEHRTNERQKEPLKWRDGLARV